MTQRSTTQPRHGRQGQALLASLVAALMVFIALPPPLSNAAELALTPCRIDGVPEEVLCGRHEVYENRQAASGRKISLNIAVLPALSQQPAPDPLFLLAGGPGQAATDLGAVALSNFRKVRAQRDIVLVDLRGTGDSNALDCEFDPGTLAGVSGEPLAPEDFTECLDGLDADVRFYTTDLAIDDLDEIRAGLGYEQVNLWGGSYGTRAAMVYLERHPQRVRSAVLDGLAPYDIKLPLFYARDGQRALDLLLEDCASQASCREAFPTLGEDLERLLAELAGEPVEVAGRHPRTGEAMAITVTADDFASNLRNFLYTPRQASLAPFLIARAAGGDFAPYVAASFETQRWSLDSMSLGLTLSVLCSEDLPRISDEDVQVAVENTFLGRLPVDTWRQMCEPWPRGQAPTRADEALIFEAPALLLSGHLDPVTPPAWGDTVAQRFPDGRHVVVPGAAHNTLGSRCVQRLMADFIDAGSAADLDTSCVETVRRPPFVVGLAGAVP
ncbi:MAG: alpha/beta fold hydrolase [Acidobacteriota bacterium]